MSLASELIPHIRAGFSGIWVRSDEHDDAIQEIMAEATQRKWSVSTFDFNTGMNTWGPSGGWIADNTIGVNETATLTTSLAKFRSQVGDTSKNFYRILILRNIHMLFQNAMNRATLFAALLTSLQFGKTSGNCYICLAPTSQLPPELEKQFVLLDHMLPDAPQIEAIIKAVATNEGDIESPAVLQAAVSAAAGCTRATVENAAALSIVQKNKIDPAVIWDVKAQSLKKSGALSVYTGQRGFAEGVIGCSSMKTFTQQILLNSEGSEHKARGIVLVGPPGVGKSEFAKALGFETKRKTVILDPGALRGKYLGESEERTRQALATIDAMGKIVLMIDEVNHAMESGSGETDGGVGSHILANMLTWMNDRTGDAFIVATCNDIAGLPLAFTRAERFDAIFFVDLPKKEAKQGIWLLYMRKFGLIGSTDPLPVNDLPDDSNWSGAEIRACCRLAHLMRLSVEDTAQYIVPWAQTSKEQLDRLRDWSANRCLSADSGTLYNPAESQQAEASSGRRHVSRT